MFERNKIDNAPEAITVPVDLSLVNGEQERGKLLVPMGKTAADVLNGPAMFIDFEPYQGDRRFIAKAQLASIRLVSVPRMPSLGRPGNSNGDFDPHQILGISTESNWDEIRQAYVQLSKAYHPDRYSTAALPTDVKDYLETMSRRINAAYQALEAPHKAVKRVTNERSQPVFTSPPRV